MKKLMKGNEAIAEAAILAGCRHFFGYPITPQNQIPEYMSRRMPQVGGCYLQAESEVAAINMVYGAAAAGARAMTSSSSPGISLKQEGISYLAGSELPCVVVNIARGGPGLGSIQPAQSDYHQATRGGGHGDYRVPVLAPSSVQEAVTLTQLAFDIADRYRNPVMVLGDGLIGQMMEPVDMDTAQHYEPPADLPPKTWAATGHVPDLDSPRAVVNSLFIDPTQLEAHNLKLQKKYDAIEAGECRWQEENLDDAEIVLVAYGATSRIARGAMRRCRTLGLKVGLLRPITLWPFPAAALRRTLSTAKRYICLEMSLGQMVDDVRLAINGARPVDFYGRAGGMVPTVSEVVQRIQDAEPLSQTQDPPRETAEAAPEARSYAEEDEPVRAPQDEEDPAAQIAGDVERLLRQAARKVDQAVEAVGAKLGGLGPMADGLASAIGNVVNTIRRDLAEIEARQQPEQAPPEAGGSPGASDREPEEGADDS